MNQNLMVAGDAEIGISRDGGLLVSVDTVSGESEMNTVISGEQSLDIAVNGTLDIASDILNGEGGFSYQVYGGNAQQYTGEYTVTPALYEQVLETADKLMTSDVTVREIQSFEVSNDAGGETLYIASEV